MSGVGAGQKTGGEGPRHIVERLPLHTAKGNMPAGGKVARDIHSGHQRVTAGCVGLHIFVHADAAECAVGVQFAADSVIGAITQRGQRICGLAEKNIPTSAATRSP